MVYWEKAGKINTEKTVGITIQRAKDLEITHLVVASNSGATATLFLDKGFTVVCVTHHIGFTAPGFDEMGEQMRQKLLAQGVKILTTTHLMAGLDRAVRNNYGGIYPAE